MQPIAPPPREGCEPTNNNKDPISWEQCFPQTPLVEQRDQKGRPRMLCLDPNPLLPSCLRRHQLPTTDTTGPYT